MRMRIAHSWFVLSSVLLGASVVVAGQPKYGVTVQTVKPEALAKVKTYIWDKGRPSFDKDVDARIVAAVDRELAAHSLAKLPSGSGDVVVRYASQSRTDTDVKSKPSKSGELRDYAVGSLVLDLTDAANRQVLFRVRMDTPIERDPATIGATIDAAVAAMFAKYPTPAKR
jgi:uncharacterized protein DUF4136